MPTHIALMGRARSGKDTVAAHLVANYGYKRVAFADPLKEMALKADPLIVSQTEYEDGDETTVQYRLSDIARDDGWEGAKDVYPEVRRFLQSLGSAVRDVLGEDTWLEKGMDTARWHMSEGHPVVFTDVRYMNEASALRWHGFTMVRIERPASQNSGPASAHASETELDGYIPDHVLVNDGSVSDLIAKVEALLPA